MIHKTSHRFKDARTGEVIVIELDIDVDAVSRVLAKRVINSKTGAAIVLYGAVKAKRVKND